MAWNMPWFADAFAELIKGTHPLTDQPTRNDQARVIGNNPFQRVADSYIA